MSSDAAKFSGAGIDGKFMEQASEAEEGTPLLKATSRSRRHDDGVFAKGGIFSNAICLIKTSIGAGVLSMAANTAEVGLSFMLPCLVTGGVLVVVSLKMITEVSLSTECWSFEDICETLFHPALAHLTGLMQTINCLGSCVAYLVLGGQIFQTLTGVSDDIRHIFVVMVGLLICMPLSLARDINFLRHLSVLSVGALLSLVFAVGYILILNGVDTSITRETLWHGKNNNTVFTYMNCCSIVIFAYSVQSIMPKLTSEVSDRNSAASSISKSIQISTIFVAIFYTTVSILGLITFGTGANQRDTLILDLQPYKTHAVVLLAEGAVICSVTMCFEFNIYPMRQFVAYQIRKLYGRAPNHDEKLDRLIFGVSETRFLDIWASVLAVFVAVVLAVKVTSIRAWLELVGAFASAYLAFVVPPMWILSLRRRERKLHWASAESLFCMGLIVGGVFLSAFGTYSALRR